MSAGGIAKPYLEAWLRRTRKQLSASGRLTELAMILAQDQGGTKKEWRSKLQEIMDGGSEPSLELLTRIDSLLAKSADKNSVADCTGDLFE